MLHEIRDPKAFAEMREPVCSLANYYGKSLDYGMTHAHSPSAALPTTLFFCLLFTLPSLFGQVVINEIHYDPDVKTEHVEFIELHNAGGEAVDLTGWRFEDGVEYTFAAGTAIETGAYLVITENKPQFDAKFGSVFAGGEKAFDQWHSGALTNDGETVTLLDATGETVDEVDYQSTFPWPIAANGDGVSMELINPSLDNDLGGSWRSSIAKPSPGKVNTVFADNSAPQIRQVNHTPKMPTTSEATVITAKASDPDTVASVELIYQTVAPGNYIQSLLAKSSSVWKSRPLDPREPNPEFEDAANWQTVAMVDDGTNGDEAAGDSIFTATLPEQGQNRTLVRYRVLATDGAGASVRVPYDDDESRNFAYFVYDGIPAYKASERSSHPDGAPYTHSPEVLTSLPVYFLLTDEDEFDQCIAYSAGDQVDRNNYNARSAFNWSGTFVYDGVVYDHIKYRLRQRNDRYGRRGKRSMRFRFNRGSHAQFHDHWGRPYPTKWRTLNSGKLNASRGGYNYGINEFINHELWNLVGVPAPSQHWYHFRVVKGREEVPKGTIFGPNKNAQWTGDFFGMYLGIEDYDSRFLDAHGLADGNLYKLISNRLNGLDVQRVQGKYSIDDGTDYSNILLETRTSKDASWLIQHINYDHYNRYHAIIEAVRHFDVAPNLAEHLKNRSFYFSPPTEEHPLGLQHTLPWDSETSWGPNWNGGVDWVKQAMSVEDKRNRKPDREPFRVQYKNTVREVRDLIWQPDQISIMLDRIADKLEPFSYAERDRWRGGPREAGSESIPDDIREWVAEMNKFAWEGGSWVGGNGPTTNESRDSGISGQQGRDDYLDWLAEDSAAPSKPTIIYTGPDGFPADGLNFTTTAYKSGTLFNPGEPFAAMEWRLAEITDPSLPDYEPNAPFKWEWTAHWESGALATFAEGMTIPATAVRAGRTYRARVRMIDTIDRTSKWSDPIQFTAAEPTTITNLQESLRITEIMYHPSTATDNERALGYSSSDFEFLEVQNIGNTAIDLNGARFTKGIDFDFEAGEVTLLEPGTTVVLVANTPAFRARYGDEPIIAGEFGNQAEARLSNGGETIKLSFGGGTPITEFRYNDKAPWPTGADGAGYSLILASTEPGIDLNAPTAWVQSADLGGSPGLPGGGGALGDGPVSGDDNDDNDGDGMSNDAEALAGTDPEDPNSLLKINSVVRDADAMSITWTSVSGKVYRLEYAQSLDAVAWENVNELAADGVTASLLDPEPTRWAFEEGYYRLRVLE